MTTTAAMVAECRRLLESGSRDELNRLNGSITNSATTLTAEFTMGGIAEGAKLGMEFEVAYVWSVSGQVATVQRAVDGSTAANHADDTIIRVNPRFTDWAIFEALRQELVSYSSPRWGLYRVRTVDITYSASTMGYNLTSVTDLLDILSVESDGWLAGDRLGIRSWRLVRDQDTADFASGLSLQLYEGVSGKPIRVAYKAPFAALTTTSADITTDTGFPESAHDIPPLGAAARLVASREVKRAFTESQPESRAAADVPPGTNRGAAATLLALRDARLREEALRLHQMRPVVARP